MSKRKYVRGVAIGVAVVLNCISVALPAGAVVAGTANEKLSSLEAHFFQHPYDSETDSQRLGRLEILVFGQRRAGSNDERLAALQRAVAEKRVAGVPAGVTESPVEAPTETMTPFSSKTASPTHEANNLQQANNTQAASAPPFAPAYSQSRQSQPLSGSIEQTVSALETQVLGETHRDQPLAARVSSLETTVGAQAGSGSLMDRVNRIKIAVGNEADLQSGAAAPAYKQAYTSQTGVAPRPPAPPKVSNGHPVLKKAAEAALVVGAVAGVAALTIMATKGMGGGRHFHKLDLD